MKENDILKKYIADKYGSISKFLKKENFSFQGFETALNKKDIFHEIAVGLRVCGYLKIDAAELFCNNEIVSTEPPNNEDDKESKKSLDEIIKEKYAELSGDDRKKALDFADYIFKNGV